MGGITEQIPRGIRVNGADRPILLPTFANTGNLQVRR